MLDEGDGDGQACLVCTVWKEAMGLLSRHSAATAACTDDKYQGKPPTVTGSKAKTKNPQSRLSGALKAAPRWRFGRRHSPQPQNIEGEPPSPRLEKRMTARSAAFDRDLASAPAIHPWTAQGQPWVPTSVKTQVRSVGLCDTDSILLPETLNLI